MLVSVNVLHGNGNAVNLCGAMAKGINASGDKAVSRSIEKKDMTGFDAAVLWGFTTPCQDVVAACTEAGIPWVFMDMGYQLRNTHFKVTVNNRHPDNYLMEMGVMPDIRFKQWGVKIKPWKVVAKPDDPIIVAGMSPKAAWSFGFGFEEYERETIAKLRQVTKRPIVYRPKASNSPNAKPIEGTMIDGRTPIADALAKAHCVVTHHSNVGCDALLAGVPVFTRRGAARALGLGDNNFDLLEAPYLPENRDRWAANLAYCQWSAKEMESGACWQHMKYLMGLEAVR